MEMERLSRVRYVTENYHSLQGLRYLPALIFALVVMVGENVPLYRPGDLNVRFVLLGISILANRLIARYYRQTFGEIEVGRRRVELVWFVGMIAAGVLDAYLQARISLLGVAVAAFWLYYWWQSNGIRTHYLAMGVVTAFVSLLPLVITPLNTGRALVTLIVVIVAIVGMVMDHLLLVRLMKPAQGK